MRQLTLTGLGEETDLATGQTQYVLVFNKTLRIPTTEDVVRQVIEMMQEGEQAVERQEPRQFVPQMQVEQLPPDHGAAQKPFQHPMPPRQGPPMARNGDYSRPPTAEPDDDDAGAPQY